MIVGSTTRWVFRLDKNRFRGACNASIAPSFQSFKNSSAQGGDKQSKKLFEKSRDASWDKSCRLERSSEQLLPLAIHLTWNLIWWERQSVVNLRICTSSFRVRARLRPKARAQDMLSVRQRTRPFLTCSAHTITCKPQKRARASHNKMSSLNFPFLTDDKLNFRIICDHTEFNTGWSASTRGCHKPSAVFTKSFAWKNESRAHDCLPLPLPALQYLGTCAPPHLKQLSWTQWPLSFTGWQRIDRINIHGFKCPWNTVSLGVESRILKPNFASKYFTISKRTHSNVRKRFGSSFKWFSRSSGTNAPDPRAWSQSLTCPSIFLQSRHVEFPSFDPPWKFQKRAPPRRNDQSLWLCFD